MTHERVDTIGSSFETLSRLVSAGGRVSPERLVDVASQLVPDAEYAAVTLIRGDRPATTIAFTGEVSRAVDALQHRIGQGPCLDASTGDDVVSSNDLSTERRWPEFAAACIEQIGVRSMLCVRLRLSEHDRGALNFSSSGTDAFRDEDVAEAVFLAPFATLVVQQYLHARDVTHYQDALTSSRMIGTAIGILMSQHGVTSEAAFEMLRASSQHLNRKLRDIAADVSYIGDLP